MSFGKWIFVAFVLFFLFISVLVTICFRQDIPLVSKTYYQDALVYDQKMNYKKNVNKLEYPPQITFTKKLIKISFPMFNQLDSGELYIQRPSNSRLDYTFKLNKLQDTIRYFPLPTWQKGLYRVRMKWSMRGKNFYIEKSIIL